MVAFLQILNITLFKSNQVMLGLLGLSNLIEFDILFDLEQGSERQLTLRALFSQDHVMNYFGHSGL